MLELLGAVDLAGRAARSACCCVRRACRSSSSRTPAASTASMRSPNTARPAIATPAATSAVDPSSLSVRNTATPGHQSENTDGDHGNPRGPCEHRL